MNTMKRKLLWCGFVAYLSVPGMAYSAPGTLADQPLWLGTAVKHNLMFAIDDSGSMDWELSFAVRDGTPRLRSDGNFVDSSGNMLNSGGEGQYAYVFANGADTGGYDGRRLYTNRYAIPPIRQYASARSAAYNSAYYDPNVTYTPWPTYVEYTDDVFDDASVTATLVEPVTSVFGSRTVNLFAMLNTANKTENYWDYDIRDADMVCKETGESDCSDNSRQDYTFYPATYYQQDTTSTYYYNANWANSVITSTNSVVVEAEDADNFIGIMKRSTQLQLDPAIGATDAARITASQDNTVTSGGDFIGTIEASALNSANSAPNTGNAMYNVSLPAGRISIWIRNNGVSNATDSIWGRLQGYSTTSTPAVTLSNPNSTGPDGEYGAMRDNVSTDGTWTWTKWGEIDLPTAGSHTFELAYRETGFYVDQLLFTTESIAPVGIQSIGGSGYTGTPQSCATDTSVAKYLEFARSPGRFRQGPSDSDPIIDGFGFDGACLKKYEIGRTGADSDPFVNGTSVTRTVLEEKQNFANWFQYYRRRHQAMRGGLSASIQGINGIKTGMFWINNRRTVGAAQMKDVGVAAELGTFLDEHYSRVNSGGTPLRSALNHARRQFVNTSGPITSECQKNYTLLFTDGFNTETSYSGVNNEDGTAGAPYEDNYSGSLADIAYKAYNDNLRTDLTAGAVRVEDACGGANPDSWLDCNTNPHMNTYTVGLGLTGNIFGVTHATSEDAHNSAPTWPNISNEGLPQIDDLYHAAVNGRGEMYSATSPDTLKTALRSAIDDIVASIGSGSGVTFNSSSLKSTDGTAIYTTLFNSSNWTGDLRGRLLNQTTGDVEDLVWKDAAGNGAGVATLLDERVISTNPRVILTTGVTRDGNDVVQASGVGTGFQWANLSDTQRADLRTNSDASTSTVAVGQERLAFVRGDRSEEGNLFRARSSRMADIIHSAPAYVGQPASNWPNEAPFGVATDRYEDFAEETLSNGGASDRIPAVYVGANGGMLHGFNAQNTGAEAGQELMAYIPSMVYSNSAGEGLHYLTDPNYSHRNYVDLTPVVQDVYTTTNGSGTKEWRTVLIGGLRGGGKGLFALDVTNPSKFSEADTASNTAVTASDTVMWEYTEADDASHGNNLGYLISSPLITMLNDGTWAVIFGNGYESINGRAVLMILSIEEGLDGTWDATGVRTIDTGVGSSADKNGLSGITAIDLNSDMIPDRVYAGDIKGNMWVFDLSDGIASNWGVAHQDAGSPAPLFSAEDSNGKAQPITAAPSVAFNSAQKNASGKDPNLLVTYGTGQYLANGDQSNSDVQSYYTVWDNGQGNKTRSDLVSRTLTETNGARNLTGTTIDWTSNQGWYVDFAVTGVTGERVTQKPIMLFDSEVGPIGLFASLIPDASECSGGGSSVLYAMPLLTGLNPTKAILDLNGDGVFDSSDFGVGKTSVSFINDPNVLGNNIYSAEKDQSGSGTGISREKHNASTASEREGRLGWLELINQ